MPVARRLTANLAEAAILKFVCSLLLAILEINSAIAEYSCAPEKTHDVQDTNYRHPNNTVFITKTIMTRYSENMSR